MKVSVQLFFLTILLNGCHGQTGTRIEECESHVANASKMVNSFYSEKKQILLSDALKEVEFSINCPETKAKSIEMKISILALQLQYEKAYEFINSLSENDFSKSYKKDMQYHLFKALSFESKSDIKNRNANFKQSIEAINQFIGKSESIDQEAYYDLFLVKSKILKKEEINQELNALKINHPSDAVFFELLKESFNEEAMQGTLQKVD